MKVIFPIFLFLSITSFKFARVPPLQINTKSYNDTIELIITYSKIDTPIVIKRIFRHKVFCIEEIFIKKQLVLSNSMRWTKRDSLYYGSIETNYINNIPVCESWRYNNSCEITSRDINYRSFSINDTTSIELGYHDNGIMSNCILYYKDKRSYGLEFDSTSTYYGFGYFEDLKKNDVVVLFGAIRAIVAIQNLQLVREDDTSDE